MSKELEKALAAYEKLYDRYVVPEGISEHQDQFVCGWLASQQAEQHPEQAEGAQGEVHQALSTYAMTYERHIVPEGISEHQDQYVRGWQARAALAQPSPKCATCNDSGQIVVSGPHYCGEFQPPEYETEPCDMCAQPSPAPELVGRQVSVDVSTGDHDAAHRIFAEVVEVTADGTLLCEKARDNNDMQAPELERPEVVGYLDPRNIQRMRDGKISGFMIHDERDEIFSDEAMTIAQHQRIDAARVAEIERLKGCIQEWERSLGGKVFMENMQLRNELDATLSRLAEMELHEPIGEVVAFRLLNQLGEVMTEWHDGAPPEKFEDYRGNPVKDIRVQVAYASPAAQARVAELEKHEPVAWALQRKSDGFVRATWHQKPSETQYEIAELDGDIIAPLYAIPADQVLVSRELLERIDTALTRHLSQHGPMRVPPDPTDSDLVRDEIRALLNP